MHLYYVLNYLTNTTGGEHFLADLACEMRKQGHSVTILAGYSDPTLEEELKGLGIEVLSASVLDPEKLPYHQPANVALMLYRLTRKISESASKETEIVIHTNSHFPNLITYFIRKPCIGSIYHIENLAELTNAYAKYFGYIVQDVLEVNAPYTILHTLSIYTAEMLKSRLFRQTPVVIIPPGIRLQKYLSLKRKPELGHYLMIGRLEPRKHYEHAILAMKLAVKRNPNLKLTIIGDGPSKTNLEALIKKYSLEKNITLLGKTPENEKLDLLSQAEALVHLGYPEGFGIVIIEALAAGTPVIAYNVPPLNELVKHGIAGLLVPQNNIRSLASDLLFFHKFYFNEEYLREVAKKYELKRIAEIFRSVYETLAKKYFAKQ